jgi:Rrf2 family protein
MRGVSPGWFMVAVQGLVLLERAPFEVCSSAWIAESMNAHAVFLRRILSALVRARLIDAREGRNGGYRLARPATEITLADVYRAVQASSVLAHGLDDLAEACPLGSSVHGALSDVVAEVEQAALQVLARHTVAEIARRVPWPPGEWDGSSTPGGRGAPPGIHAELL